jgi:hypothetical protein
MLFTLISIVALLVSGACYSKAVKADGFSISPVGMSELLKFHHKLYHTAIELVLVDT